ncbi:hypothetical protein EXIGLDRAFT_273150 [Exidia glandulosa HHB12029]|uniref:Uncharacterized protein n=1 Tax=Exidia glandulosa HHB12029 TaxID=1314781 RepID=A0A165DL35_EXIGL|nr:hypothetical protein EXIGLDRAFT_273150 [Exidia glandulosa HHB12029]
MPSPPPSPSPDNDFFSRNGVPTHPPVGEDRGEYSRSTDNRSSSSSATVAPYRAAPSSLPTNGVPTTQGTQSPTSVTEAPGAAASPLSGDIRGSLHMGLAGSSRSAGQLQPYTAQDAFAGVVVPIQSSQHSDLGHTF